MEEQPLRARPVWRALAGAALLYHLTAITFANLPATTALGSGIHRPFAHYLALFGLNQTWDMFTTIPHFLDMNGVLVVKDAEGHETPEGPLLPGLAGYKKDNRIHVTFMRLAFNADLYPGYPVRYLAGVCRALLQKHGKLPASVGFELQVKELRPLADIQRDHRIAEPKTFHFGPSGCAP